MIFIEKNTKKKTMTEYYSENGRKIIYRSDIHNNNNKTNRNDTFIFLIYLYANNNIIIKYILIVLIDMFYVGKSYFV